MDRYLEAQGLWRNGLFKQVVQAVLELAKPSTDERATLEYAQNHLAGGGVMPMQRGCWTGSGFVPYPPDESSGEHTRH